MPETKLITEASEGQSFCLWKMFPTIYTNMIFSGRPPDVSDLCGKDSLFYLEPPKNLHVQVPN